MLRSLHIKNIVLIKEIKIDFFYGFSVFSGETGAGKSILLDSLSLTLGERANFNLIRHGENQAEVSAVFSVSQSHLSLELLKENSIEASDDIIIRRIITTDGKSKSFINDTPVSVTFLRQIGATLIDIHGQFDNQRLINQSFHRDILDSFLEDKSLLLDVKQSWETYKIALKNYDAKLSEIKDLTAEREYIEYSLEELNKLNPQEFEEKELLEKKHLMSNGKKILGNLADVEKNLVSTDILSSLHKSIRSLDNIKNLITDNEEIDKLIDLFDNAYTKVSDSIDGFEVFRNSLNFDEAELKYTEERIMDLRAIAKKHRVLSEDLPKLREDFEAKLQLLKKSNNLVDDIKNNLDIKYSKFKNLAEKLSIARRKSADIVDKKVNGELAFLKLSNAEFKTNIAPSLDGEFGIDKVVFKVKTNIGSDFGDLNKVASGGEMARFMLALKIVLAEVDIIGTIILDEIDIGVGGEVAEAIGQRLLYLSEKIQTIVVTHSHQVASKGENHYKVLKETIQGEVLSKLVLLSTEERIEEIARMLSGAEITEQARATAITLLIK